jgi:hypothetical protein
VESEHKACQELIHRLKDSVGTFSELLDNYRSGLETLQNVLTIHERNKAQHYREQVQAQHALPTSDFRIVEQRFQFTQWDTWSCQEQIENSIATDEASAVNGNCSLPKCCFLKLKEE